MTETINTKVVDNKDSKLVFKPQIARQLLKLKNTIIDIKPDKADPRRSVFVFDNTEKFQHDFNEILNDLADERRKERRKERKEFVKEPEQKGA